MTVQSSCLCHGVLRCMHFVDDISWLELEHPATHMHLQMVMDSCLPKRGALM